MSTTKKKQLRYLFLEDQSTDFDDFDKIIKKQINELGYTPKNVVSKHQTISDFIKNFDDRTDDNIFNQQMNTFFNPIFKNENDVIIFVDVVWNNNDRAGLDFVKSFLSKLYPNTQNKIIFLTVKSFDKKYNGYNHIDKNKLKGNDDTTLTELKTYIKQALNIENDNEKTKTSETKIDV